LGRKYYTYPQLTRATPPRHKWHGFPSRGENTCRCFIRVPGDSSHDINVGDSTLGLVKKCKEGWIEKT